MTRLRFEGPTVGLASIVDAQRDKLASLLAGIPTGRRLFLLDEQLVTPLNFLAADFFTQQDVRPLSKDVGEIEKDVNLVAIFYAETAPLLVELLHGLIPTRPDVTIHLLVAPYYSLYLDETLEELDLAKGVTTLEVFDYSLVPLDTYLFSLNVHDSARLLLRGELLPIQRAVSGLLLLTEQVGSFGRICARGSRAVAALEQYLDQVRASPEAQQSLQKPVAFTHVFIIDRGIDMLTPCLDPWTYEALIADHLAYRDSILETDGRSLNSVVDPIFGRLRAVHISDMKQVTDEVIAELRELASEQEQVAANRDAVSLQRIRLVMERSQKAKLEYQLIDVHLDIAKRLQMCLSYGLGHMYSLKREMLCEDVSGKRLVEAVEGYVLENAPLCDILRLISIWCITNTSPTKTVASLLPSLSARYGPAAELAIERLTGLGLLTGGKALYKDLVAIYDLLRNGGSGSISQVFNFIAAPSIALIEKELRAMASEAVAVTTHPDGEGYREVPRPRVSRRAPEGDWNGSVSKDVQLGTPSDPHNVLLLFLGGVTYAEVASSLILDQQLGDSTSIVIVGTEVQSGRALIESVMKE
ncbi:Sec1 family protein [Giardia muris]|uniref:Sec1 family protein n=1 Tax=Giardia muris TaxID=5742 RepID=A0A4Z1T472_GIAMU|nr:Sec1 family protein [Giardia muris]|eukprot:TNJ27847.1 Sec1 family protein [Giardia muris]